MTAFETAFERAGYNKAEMRAFTLAQQFMKEFGTDRNAWLTGFDKAAARMRSEGLPSGVQQDQRLVADAPRPMLDEGHAPNAQEGHGRDAGVQQELRSEGQTAAVQQDQRMIVDAPRPNTSGGHYADDQKVHAQPASAGVPIASGKARRPLPVKAGIVMPPAREPSATDITSMRRAADLTFGEIVKLRGKILQHMQFKQLQNLRSLNNYENEIIKDCIDYGRMNRIRDDAKIGLSIPPSELAKIVKRAKNHIQSRAIVTAAAKAKKGKRAHA